MCRCPLDPLFPEVTSQGTLASAILTTWAPCFAAPIWPQILSSVCVGPHPPFTAHELTQLTSPSPHSIMASQTVANVDPPSEATSSPDSNVSTGQEEKADAPPTKKTVKFWSIFFAVCLMYLSTSLESTVVTTALPRISEEIHMGNKYVWVGNSFLLASAVAQPFVGQLADVFGRRWPLLITTALFTLGSGVSGGATDAAMMISGRTLQGLGAGGILLLADVVISDMLPLRERAMYLGLARVSGVIGLTTGPVIGGAIANTNWRWCFYLMLVTGGLALVYLVFFGHFKHEQRHWRVAVAQIDYVGAFLFMASVTALLLGLVMGGVVYPWSSANVIVPIVLGVIGWICFHVYETTTFCKNPMVPPRLFSNRTATAGFILAFDAAALVYYFFWFLPVYFQGVLGASPLTSGVNQLPSTVFLGFAGVIAAGVVTKTGKYKLGFFIGFAMSAIGAGLFTLLDAGSSTAAWVCFQIVAFIGMGINITTVLPVIQAALTDADIGAVTAMYAFMRSFGAIWGVTIPSTVFNSQVNNYLGRISDPSVREAFSNGNAYELASSGQIQRLPTDVKNEVLGVYTDALATVWQVAIALSLAGFVASFFVKQLDMSRENESKFGLQEDVARQPGETTKIAQEKDAQVSVQS